MTNQNNKKQQQVGENDNIQNTKTTNQIIEEKIMVNENTSPEQLKVSEDALANPPPKQNEAVDLNDPKIKQEIAEGKRDNLGNENKSRGMVGFVSNPDKLRQMEQEARAKNPQTQQDLETMLKIEATRKEYEARRSEEMGKKIRLTNFGYEYNPPEEFKDEPMLAPVSGTKVPGPRQTNEEKPNTVNTESEIIDVEKAAQAQTQQQPETVS